MNSSRGMHRQLERQGSMRRLVNLSAQLQRRRTVESTSRGVEIREE